MDRVADVSATVGKSLDVQPCPLTCHTQQRRVEWEAEGLSCHDGNLALTSAHRQPIPLKVSLSLMMCAVVRLYLLRR